jgi:hypothetical protein
MIFPESSCGCGRLQSTQRTTSFDIELVIFARAFPLSKKETQTDENHFSISLNRREKTANSESKREPSKTALAMIYEQKKHCTRLKQVCKHDRKKRLEGAISILESPAGDDLIAQHSNSSIFCSFARILCAVLKASEIFVMLLQQFILMFSSRS